jgi:hypothetical protein
MRAKWNWYALGGKFSGMLEPLDIADTVTGGPEYPDDELSREPDPRYEPGSGVDALRRRNLECIELPPGVVVWDGRWHETKNFTWELGLGGRPMSFWLGDVDPAAPILWGDEGLAVGDEWERKFDELLEAVPPDYWISIVDCRAA